MIYARVQWAVLVYKGSCRERGRQCLAQCQGHVEEQRGIGGLTTVQSATVHAQCRAHNLTAVLLPPQLVGAAYKLLFPTGCRCQHSLW